MLDASSHDQDTKDAMQTTEPREVYVPQSLFPKFRPQKRDKPLLLPIGSTFLKRFQIKSLIGAGGYGEIYAACDKQTGIDLAIKIEPKIRRHKLALRMMLEQRVLRELTGRPHSPPLIGSGHLDDLNYLILPLLSVNLSDLMKSSPYRRLSKQTVGRIIVQGIAALRELHLIGYVHRDVKPANICFGLTPSSYRRLILLDYGLVRRYLNEDGSLRPWRENCGFRGTMRYVSLRVHKKKEQAPCDDLVSLMYTGMELLISELPWKTKTSGRHIKRSKEHFNQTDFAEARGLAGDVFLEFARMVYTLQGDDEPDYDMLQKVIEDMYKPHQLLDPFDWENKWLDISPEPSPSRYRTAFPDASGLASLHFAENNSRLSVSAQKHASGT